MSKIYIPQELNVPVLLYRASKTSNKLLIQKLSEDNGWRRVANKQLFTVNVNAEHFSIMEDEHIKALVKILATG